jgi:tetratricopeptide (TPR) repeat protein
MQIKQRLLNLLRLAYNEEQVFFAKLSDRERSAIGKLEQWSAKDLIAHLGAWKERQTQKITATLRGENPPIDGNLDEINSKIFEENRNTSWDDILKYAERGYSSAVDCVRAVPDAKLVDSRALPWQEGKPLWRIIVGNGYVHPITHLTEYYSKKGDSYYATKISEKSAELLMQLSDNPSWLGIVKYNLACCYAISNQQGKAIIKLKEALKLNSDLIEWSKEDPDLASIRELPKYQSIYTE